MEKINARRVACAAFRRSRPGLVLGIFNISYFDLADPVPLAVIDCKIAWGTEVFDGHIEAGRQDDAKKILLFRGISLHLYVAKKQTCHRCSGMVADVILIVKVMK